MRLTRIRTTLSAAAIAALLAGCSASGGTTTTSAAAAIGSTVVSSDVSASIGTTVADALAANLAAVDTTGAAEYDEADVVAVDLDDPAASSGVAVDDGTITITAAGTYQLSGTLEDGQVVVDSAGDGVVRLVLDGADITSSTTAAIAVMDAEQAVVVLADGSRNHLADAAEYASADEEPNAALYSSADR